MGTVADPRKEILTASRFRSGSLQREKSENIPPSLQPRQNSEKGDYSPTRQRTGGDNYNKPNSRTGLFGSNVSKIKEMFQANAPPPTKSEMHHNPPDAEKSPESKRKRTELGTRTRQAPVQQPHTEQGLLDATNHVQRFIHTRALFARLEGTSHPSGGTDQKKAGGATPSPIISPNTSTPTSPTASKHSDEHFTHKQGGDIVRIKHANEDINVPKGSFLENRPTTLNINAKSYNSGLLWKRRQNENNIGGNYYGGAKRNEEENMDVDALDSEQSNTKYDLSVTSGYRSRSADSNRRAFQYDKIRSVSNDRGQNIPHSTTQKHYISSSSAEHSDENSEVVMRRKPESNKRLSKQEIQAAIDKADNYLSHLTTGSDFQSKRRSWELREQMSESSDSKVGPISRLTPRNRSRSADTLDSGENEPNLNRTYYTGRSRRTLQKTNESTDEVDITSANDFSDKLSRSNPQINVSSSKVHSELPDSKANVPSKPPVPTKPSSSTGRQVNSPRPVPSPRKPVPTIPQRHTDSHKSNMKEVLQESEPLVESSFNNISHFSSRTLKEEVIEPIMCSENTEKVQHKPTTPSSVQIEVVSSLGDDFRPDTPQSMSSMTSSPRDSPPPPPLSPPPPLPQSSVPPIVVDQEHVTSVISAAHSVLDDRPPPPPYPDESREPPPPYPATSHQKADEPPSPAPCPGQDEDRHTDNNVADYAVQMRTKFGAEISESAEDDLSPPPPTVTVNLVNQLTSEQQRSPR